MPLLAKTVVEQRPLLLIGKHLLAIIDRAITPELIAIGIDGIHTVVINAIAKPAATPMAFSPCMSFSTSMPFISTMQLSAGMLTLAATVIAAPIAV
ncbi:hypothetical protein HMPREF1167_00826, partial [Aeromonas veronii AER39]